MRKTQGRAVAGWMLAAVIAIALAARVDAARQAGAPPDSASQAAVTADTLAVPPADAITDTAAGDFAATDTTTTIQAAPCDPLAELRANFTPQSRSYSDIKTVLRFVAPFYGLVVGLILLFSGLSGWMRDIAHSMGHSRYIRVLVYLVLFVLVAALLRAPLTWYNDFAVEHQFGLSNQSLPQWLAAQGKAMVLTVVILGIIPIQWLITTVLARSPHRWWLWLGLGLAPFLVAATLLTPIVIEPVFNRFTPLHDVALRSHILALAERAGIPGRKVVEVNKSAQTKKYNAYVSGFGASQRIVLWDTTLKGLKQDEILFIMGHEMGHYRLGHIWKGVAVGALLGLVLLWATALIGGWAVRRFGDVWGFHELSDVAAIPLLLMVIDLLTFVVQPGVNAYTRRVETQADQYGIEITQDNDAASRAFVRMASQNKDDPDPPPFVKWMLYSHPPDAERVRMALHYRPWAEGQANRFYHGGS